MSDVRWRATCSVCGDVWEGDGALPPERSAPMQHQVETKHSRLQMMYEAITGTETPGSSSVRTARCIVCRLTFADGETTDPEKLAHAQARRHQALTQHRVVLETVYEPAAAVAQPATEEESRDEQMARDDEAVGQAKTVSRYLGLLRRPRES